MFENISNTSKYSVSIHETDTACGYSVARSSTSVKGTLRKYTHYTEKNYRLY